VREPGAGDVRVQERADRAELRDGADRREEEGTVPREDRDRLAGGDAVAREHPRQAVHERVELGVRDGLGLELERDAIGDRLGLRADEGTERVRRLLELGEDRGQVHRPSA
jgi:hypothetical protein